MKTRVFGFIDVVGKLDEGTGKSGRSKAKVGDGESGGKKRNPEFVGVVRATAALRQAMGERVDDFCDLTLRDRMFKLVYLVLKRGPAVAEGRRLRAHEEAKLFCGLEMNAKETLRRNFSAAFHLSVNAERNTVKLEVPAYGRHKVGGPKGADSYDVVLVVGVMSDFVVDGEGSDYVAVHPGLVGLSTTVSSKMMELGWGTESIELEASLPGLPELPEGAVLLVSVGTRFYKEFNGEAGLMKMGRAMRIVAAY